MSDQNPLIGVVRVPSVYQMGETMNELRGWLDKERIQPAEFKALPIISGYIFRIGFRTTDDTDRFRAQFGAVC